MCGALSETVTRPEMRLGFSVFIRTTTRCDVATNHLADALVYLSAAASLWKPQLVAPSMCSEGEHVTETHAWDAQSAEYEAQEPEWVAEADAYCGKDDAWDESSPQDCGELDELFGSLDTAKASATTELGNASQMTSAARNVMDAGKLVARVKSARGFFPGG